MSFLKKFYSKIYRKWMYFRIALILVPTLLIFGFKNTTSSRKKVIDNSNSLSTKEKTILNLNQEGTSCNNYEKPTRIIRTGSGTVLGFQKKVSVSDPNSNEILSQWNMNEGILAKNDGILPGADGFSPKPHKRHPLPRIRGQVPLPPHLEHLMQMQGFDYPKYKYKGYAELDTSLNGNRGNGKQCRAQEKTFDVAEEYRMFMEKMDTKGIEVNCDQKRFADLAANPQTGKVDEKSLIEVRGGLQAEGQGLFKDLRRTQNPKVDLDFQAVDVKTGKTIYIDHKRMPDRQTLADKGVDISKVPDHPTTAYNMGKSIPKQKKRFVGLPEGPKSPDEVLHLVNFEDIRDSSEIHDLIDKVLEGAQFVSSSNNITFINCF